MHFTESLLAKGLTQRWLKASLLVAFRTQIKIGTVSGKKKMPEQEIMNLRLNRLSRGSA